MSDLDLRTATSEVNQKVAQDQPIHVAKG